MKEFATSIILFFLALSAWAHNFEEPSLVVTIQSNIIEAAQYCEDGDGRCDGIKNPLTDLPEMIGRELIVLESDGGIGSGQEKEIPENGTLRIEMDECLIRKATHVENNDAEVTVLRARPLYSEASGGGQSHEHSDYRRGPHNHGCPAVEGYSELTENPGHTCCRPIGGSYYCSHWYCPPH